MMGWTANEVHRFLRKIRDGTTLGYAVYREYFPRGHHNYSYADQRATAERIRSELAHGAWALIDGQLRRVSTESPAKARADLYPPD